PGTRSGDYTRSGTSIVIPRGTTNGTITLTAVQDVLDEADESIVVDISNVTNGTESGTQQVTAVIADDDPSPTVTFSTAASSGAESIPTLPMQDSLSPDSGRPVTGGFVLPRSTAAAGGVAS